MMSDCEPITDCRICGSTSLYEFLNLGDMPPVNDFTETPYETVETYPLEVVVCTDCSHVQLRNTVDRELLFSDYDYFSSASTPMVEHFGAYAQTIEDQFLSADDFVVEIGCNDGVLLSQFTDSVRAVGVEPAENVAKVARENHGLDIRTEMFDQDVADSILKNGEEAKAVFANNVIGHVHHLGEFMTGVKRLLADDGLFVMEVPYLVDLINNLEFDTIYHEHISYFGIRSLRTLFQQHGMEIFDIKRQPIHGGSIRVFVQPEVATRTPTSYVSDLQLLEKSIGLDTRARYDRFADSVASYRDNLVSLLEGINDGADIIGYGAPAKGNVLLNYCDIGPDTITYIVDTTPAKQGTYTPKTGIPVEPPSRFHEDVPDYALLLAWNYRDEILAKESAFREGGGRFVVPQPYVDII